MKKEMDCHDLQASLTKTKWLVILRFRKKAKYLKKNSDRDISLCAAHSAQYDNMDLSAFSKPQYDKNLACHTELSQESDCDKTSNSAVSSITLPDLSQKDKRT